MRKSKKRVLCVVWVIVLAACCFVLFASSVSEYFEREYMGKTQGLLKGAIVGLMIGGALAYTIWAKSQRHFHLSPTMMVEEKNGTMRPNSVISALGLVIVLLACIWWLMRPSVLFEYVLFVLLSLFVVLGLVWGAYAKTSRAKFFLFQSICAFAVLLCYFLGFPRFIYLIAHSGELVQKELEVNKEMAVMFLAVGTWFLIILILGTRYHKRRSR